MGPDEWWLRGGVLRVGRSRGRNLLSWPPSGAAPPARSAGQWFPSTDGQVSVSVNNQGTADGHGVSPRRANGVPLGAGASFRGCGRTPDGTSPRAS